MLKIIFSCLIFSLLTLISISCNIEKDQYKDTMNRLFEPEIQHYFPEKIDMNPTFSVSYFTNPINNHVEGEIYTVYVSYYPIEFDSLYLNIKERSLANYSISDTCNLVVGKFQKTAQSPLVGFEWKYNSWMNKNQHCMKNNYPVPNFKGSDINEASDYTLYILESEKGIHFESEYYTNEFYMPIGWKRGYSSGVAINKDEKEFIYWLIIW